MAFGTLPLDIDKCQLNPLGRRSVTSYFLERGVNLSFVSKLDSASLGFLVSGSHADGKHAVERDHFHEEFRIGRAGSTAGPRENYNMRQDIFKLICDAVSLLFYCRLAMLIALSRAALWTA